MAHLIKIGATTINLDLVRAFSYDPDTDHGGTMVLEYTDHVRYFHGLQAEALQHYLDTVACDLLEAEAIAAAAKAPTHAALVGAGLLPAGPTAHTVWLAAQAAFRRLSGDAVLERLATFDSGDYYTIQAAIEREAAALPGAPVQSQEVSPEAFSELLARQVADGSALPFADGGDDL